MHLSSSLSGSWWSVESPPANFQFCRCPGTTLSVHLLLSEAVNELFHDPQISKQIDAAALSHSTPKRWEAYDIPLDCMLNFVPNLLKHAPLKPYIFKLLCRTTSSGVITRNRFS